MAPAATLVLQIQVTLYLRETRHKGGDREAPKGSQWMGAGWQLAHSLSTMRFAVGYTRTNPVIVF